MTHALPLRPQRSFVLGLTFHSLLPPSQTRDEFVERHGDGRSRYSSSAAEGRLLDIDDALAEQYGIVWQTIDRTAPTVAEVLDRLIVAAVDHLEQYLAAAQLAPAGSTVSKSARKRQDSVLEALDRIVGELDMQVREQPVPAADEIEHLFTTCFEQTLGVADPLVMELCQLTDQHSGSVLDDRSETRTASSSASTDDSLSGSDSGLFRVARTGLEPVIKRAPVASRYSDSSESGAVSNDDADKPASVAPQYLA